MIKALIVFGTRPEAIKLAPVIKEMISNSGMFEVFVCVSGQHRDMLDQVLEVFQIKPNYDLDVMKTGQDLYEITSSVLLGIKRVIAEVDPDFLVVHGDTSTAFASALAGFYSKKDVVHVEAGLRTYDFLSPYPEEFNRQTISKLSSLHFAPTEINMQNLLRERVEEKNIFVIGNTVIDSMFLALENIESNKKLKRQILDSLEKKLSFNWQNSKFILVTGHRRENLGEGLISVCEALRCIAQENRNLNIVYPVHMNPNVSNVVRKMLSGIENIHLIDPLDYASFLILMKSSWVILTDSGGIQEEAPSLGKPVLVTRDKTERVEAVAAGTVKLVGTDAKEIILAVEDLLNNHIVYSKMTSSKNPYGDGKASKKMIEILIKKYS